MSTMTETDSVTVSLSRTTAATVGRCLIHVGTVASKDLARGALAGIRISTATDPAGDRTLVFEGCDSYRLIHATVPVSADDSVPSFDPFVIDAKQAGKAGKLITRKNVDKGVGFTVTGPVFTLTTADGSGNVDLLTGSYPETSKLLTPDSTGELPNVDADLLSGLLSAMSGVLSDRKDVAARVSLDSVSATHPSRWSAVADDVSIVAVIMPVRK